MSGYALGSFYLRGFFLRYKKSKTQWIGSAYCINFVCRQGKKGLSERSLVDYNKKRNFELWYNVRIYLAHRQKVDADRRLRNTGLAYHIFEKY